MDLTKIEEELKTIPGKVFGSDGSLIADVEVLVEKLAKEFLVSCHDYHETLPDDDRKIAFKMVISNLFVRLFQTLFSQGTKEELYSLQKFVFDPMMQFCETLEKLNASLAPAVDSSVPVEDADPLNVA